MTRKQLSPPSIQRGWQPGDPPEKWQPDADQRRGLKFLVEHASAGLLADVGVGKTSISLGAFKFLQKRGVASRALVVSPKRPMQLVWPQEIERWLDFNHFTYQILHGTEKGSRLNEEADLHFINFEGLAWLLDWDATKVNNKARVSLDIARFKKLGYDTLIIDELSKFKNYGTMRFKAMKQVADLFHRRWGLTGSPAPRGLINLFPQCLVLDGGRTFGPYVTHFRNKYFVPGRNMYTWTLREGADEEIYERAQPLMLRLEATGRPPVIDNDISVTLPDSAMDIYKDLEQDLLAEVGDDTIRAAGAGIASMKCRQVVSGAIYSDPRVEGILKVKEKRQVIHLHDAVLDAMEDLVDELQGQPMLIAYEFHHDLERLQARFKGLPALQGTDKQVEQLVAAWNRNELPLLAVHPLSVGHGLNMQAGSGRHLAWFTLTWDYELYKQLIGRLCRRGTQAKSILNHRFLVKGTVVERVARALSMKANAETAFLDAMKKRSK